MPKLEDTPEIIEKLRNLYWAEGKSLRQIGVALGLDRKTIWEFLKKHSIPRRGRGGARLEDNPEVVETVRQMYWEEGKNLRQVGEELGVGASTIRHFMGKYKIPRRSNHQKRENHPNWKGGKTHTNCGYIIIKKPGHPRASANGYVLEHIIVWEEANGKQLPDDWVVHHFNGIRHDNRPSNLLALPKKNHHYALRLQALQKRIRELESQVKRRESQRVLL